MEILLLPLSVMGAVFITAPFLALVPAIVFTGLFMKMRQWVMLSAAILWVIYAAYEYAILLRILCSGECSICLDLLFIYPLLIIASILGLVSAFLWYRRRK